VSRRQGSAHQRRPRPRAAADPGRARPPPPRQATFAAFLPDGKSVISADTDKTIRVWEYPAGKEMRRIGTPFTEKAARPTGPINRFPIGRAQPPRPREYKRRLDEVRQLVAGNVLRGERLRMMCAVEILERLGTKDARRTLQTLADGAPGALLTTTAQATLHRLEQMK
jgi:hypothetical protein